ncbi:hypothetical protein AAFC00_005587 [Neodothiora populina]
MFALDMTGFFSKNHLVVDGRTVVITGGSQGMGRGLAKLFSKRGANVVIVARGEENLIKTLNDIKAVAIRPDQKIHYISADVTKPEENSRILAEVQAWNDGRAPDIVWANAGSSVPGLFADTSIETLRSQMDINYWAAAYLAHVTLNMWTRTPSAAATTTTAAKPTSPRHFIMTSSSAAFVGVAGYGTYSPAKAAMRSLADNLRSEVNLYNGARQHQPSSPTAPAADIKIHIVCPGTILSEGHAREDATKHEITRILEAGDPRQTEDEVAAAAVSGLDRGHYLITTQFLGHAMRASSLQGSPRNGWGVVDTLFSWVTSVAWLFIGPDMEGKVFKYGKQHGLASK